MTPRSYLRNFANSQEQVNAYDRLAERTLLPVGVGQIATESDFYTILDAAGRPSNIIEEKVLSRVDDTFARIVPKLLEPNPTLTTAERVQIDLLMTLQFLRTQEGKRFLENAMDFDIRLSVDRDLTDASEDEIDAYIRNNYSDYPEPNQDLIRRIAKDRRYRLDLSKEEWIYAIFANAVPLSDAVTVRHWLFLDSDSNAFLTTDNPVVLERVAEELSFCDAWRVKQYSADLRERLLGAIDAGLPQVEAARLFGVNVSSIKRWRTQQRQTGSVAARRRTGRRRRVRPEQEATLRAQVAATPDATLAEHCATWEATTGVRLSPATMSRTLARLDQPQKKSR